MTVLVVWRGLLKWSDSSHWELSESSAPCCHPFLWYCVPLHWWHCCTTVLDWRHRFQIHHIFRFRSPLLVVWRTFPVQYQTSTEWELSWKEEKNHRQAFPCILRSSLYQVFPIIEHKSAGYQKRGSGYQWTGYKYQCRGAATPSLVCWSTLFVSTIRTQVR